MRIEIPNGSTLREISKLIAQRLNQEFDGAAIDILRDALVFLHEPRISTTAEWIAAEARLFMPRLQRGHIEEEISMTSKPHCIACGRTMLPPPKPVEQHELPVYQCMYSPCVMASKPQVLPAWALPLFRKPRVSRLSETQKEKLLDLFWEQLNGVPGNPNLRRVWGGDQCRNRAGLLSEIETILEEG